MVQSPRLGGGFVIPAGVYPPETSGRVETVELL